MSVVATRLYYGIEPAVAAVAALFSHPLIGAPAMNLPLWTLAGVLTLIAFRRLGGLRLGIWQILLAALDAPLQVPLWLVAAGACVPVLLGSPRRVQIVRGIDWPWPPGAPSPAT